MSALFHFPTYGMFIFVMYCDFCLGLIIQGSLITKQVKHCGKSLQYDNLAR